MTIKELNDYMLHYLKKDKTQTAVMLNGEWGSGKTYYIENELVPFFKRKKATCIVVSLYGLEDISEISKNIYIELRMHSLVGKASEKITTGRVIAKNIIKNITGIAGINLSLSDEDLKQLYESVNLKDKLLIFEDVERSKISVPYLLGYVNGMVERDGVKILLVANENEILKKQPQKINFDFVSMHENEQKQEDKKIEVSEDAKQYLHIKEKTVGDTIQFSGDCKKAIKEIIKKYNSEMLNKVVNTDIIEKLTNIVNGTCKKNLRTFIFAVQKTVDIMDKMGMTEFEDEFYLYLLLGILYFSEIIKTGKFPKWEGNVCLSTKLGSNETPLMKFAYDYIRWQTFDIDAVNQAYEAYKLFRLIDENAEYRDSDLRILSDFSVETEENVLNALKNIEQKLLQPDAIGIYAYGKLAYYMTYVGAVVDFDCKKSCDLMLKNVKEIAKKTRINTDFLLEYTFDIKDEKLKEKYKDFLRKISEAIEYENNKTVFLYEPDNLSNFYTDICRNKDHYISGHQFISKYDQSKIVDMLLKCSAAQLQDFCEILFAVYRHAGKNEYDEKDVEAMKELLELVNERKNGEHHWDKIQVMQINYLCYALEQFIKQMT